MLRITKLTDYGIVLLAQLAGDETRASQNARSMAEATSLPLPVVSKILKALAHGGLVTSQRGAKGGYALSRRPEEVSVAEIIDALEGPIALMECSAGPGRCEQETSCSVRDPWQRINQAILETLRHVTLRELVGPAKDRFLYVDPAEIGGPHVERN
jgi:FeS assembly SUF system regulator